MAEMEIIRIIENRGIESIYTIYSSQVTYCHHLHLVSHQNIGSQATTSNH